MYGPEGKIHRGYLRNRLIILYSLPLLLLLLSLAAFYDYMARRSLEREMGLRLAELAAQLAEAVPPWKVQAVLSGGEGEVRRELASQLSRLALRHDLARLYLSDLQNRSLVDSRPGVSFGQTYFKHEFEGVEIAAALVHGQASSRLFRGSDGRYYKSAYAPILLDGQPLALLGLEANAAFFQNLAWIRSRVSLFLLLGTALVIAISVLFSRRLVRPLQRLVEAARRIGEGNLQQPVAAVGRGEIAFLAHTLDEMRKSIVARDQKTNIMLRGIAHELRNPLGAIELHCGLALEELPGRGEASGYLQNIRKDVANLKKLIEEFLDYGRETVLQKAPLTAGPFLRESLLPLQPELARQQIRPVWQLENEQAVLLADPEQLQRALLNLYLNALQAMPQGGELRIRQQAGDDGRWTIEIEDCGPGVPAEHQDKLFQPFFTTKKKGCGLGLALAQKIVQAHHGEISYRPGQEGGACFRLELPA